MSGWRIEEEVTGRWWWRKTRYFVSTKYCRVGPFKSRSEAGEQLEMQWWAETIAVDGRVARNHHIGFIAPNA